ncbi:MAG: hypothetical protein KAT88_03375 [Spirochaetes bacterium]|nr:hypothetical protein [Spirochaetota bacterium]
MAAIIKDKKRFSVEVAYLKNKVDEINQKIKHLEIKKDENENLNKIRVASHYVDLVSIYCAMTDLSLSLLGYKNESYLDKGRKSLYKSIIILEAVVSNYIDMPLGENYELLKSLDSFSDAERIKLVRKIGYTVSLLADRYGENSKWKWSFVEIEGRFSVIAKNLFDFRTFQAKNDPREEGFNERYDYLYLVKEFLIKASNRYREKYELTNQTADDMKKAIDYLKALKRIHILFNESEEVQNVGKRIELWSQKFETDLKAKEKKLKLKAHEKLKENR